MFAGQDQRVAVALLPEAVDHRGHQAQHAAGALELHQGRPVVVEAVEDLRVDRVGRFDPLLVVRVAAIRRELGLVLAVPVGEGAGDHVAVFEEIGIPNRLEEPPPNDLEPLLRARRPPGGFHPPDDVAQAIQRLAPPLPANLHVVGASVRRLRGVGGREADHEEAVLRELGRLGQNLGKRKLRLEAAGRQDALVVELTGVGHPLVDQDQAGTVLLEQFSQARRPGWWRSRRRP